MRSKTKHILIGALSGALLVGGLGAVAYFTNGFKDTTKIRELGKTGQVVETLKLTDDGNNFIVKSQESELADCKLLSVEEMVEEPVMNFDAFTTSLSGWKIANKDLQKMWNKVSFNDKAFMEMDAIGFHVSKEEESDTHYVEIPYFDTIRVNYAVDEPILAIAHAKNVDSEKELGTNWNFTQSGKGLYQEIGIFEGKVTADTIDFVTFSIDAVQEFEIEIESIELVNKTKAKANDVLYMYDYANHI